MFDVFISWPSAPLTESLVRKSLHKLGVSRFTSSPSSFPASRLLQWATYDDIDHDLTLRNSDTVFASSYTIRKALIRKHFLHRCVHSYITKHRESSLKRALPRTWDVEISFADELDELWADELWDLAAELELSDNWWILKPGMADRGMGIRLFNSKESLREIFENFESDSETESDGDTNVVASQLRHFVIQEYIANPLLLDPTQHAINPGENPTENAPELKGHKFHIRAYCVASGALTLYLYPRVLALFASLPYVLHTDGAALAPHLTNTSLQRHLGEEGVRLFTELRGSQILSLPSPDGRYSTCGVLTNDHIDSVLAQLTEVLRETFSAALEMAVHFQPLPNAFELFGVDFLVTHEQSTAQFNVKLLEVNAEPAIELTGPRLTWILEDLFVAIGRVCVEPFMEGKQGDNGDITWKIGETRHGLMKCLDVRVRGHGM